MNVKQEAALVDSTALDLVMRLIAASSEDEVVQALQERDLWDDRVAWVPYGDMPNNRGVVGNQQSHPVAALVEKLVNSVDSLLILECLNAGIDPRGPDAPQSMTEAIERFYGIKGGRLANLGALPPELAERIQLVVSGAKDKPNYTIIDQGEGQQPDRFPATFLSLLGENKKAIPFVQGTYNMGGTGVLQFSGEHSFQLILSKRNPERPADGSAELADHWGWTLVRRLRPGPESQQSTYVYLAPGREIPRFKAESVPARPGPYPQAGGADFEYGTYIKLWNYKLPPGLKTLATLDLRYALERYLQEPGLPVRIRERRPGYRAHTYDTTMSGLANVLVNAREVKEEGFDGGSPLPVHGVGEVMLSLSVIKAEANENKRYPVGVFLNVNGQLHSYIGTEFFKRQKLRLDYVADSLIVMVDCSRLPSDVREDLFMPSRDRMRDIPARWRIQDEISDYLSDHRGLGDLNARRRQEVLTKSIDEDTASVLQDLVRGDPTLAGLFGRGDRVRLPRGDLPDPAPYAGKRFPTYFQIAKEPAGGLVRRTPRNWTVRVEFETDADNDYFDPSRMDRGVFEVKGLASFKSVHLWNGKATMRFAIPETANSGDRMRVDVTVMDPSRVDPLESSFSIEVEEERPHEPFGGGLPRQSQLGGLPNVTEVRQAQWSTYEFDQYSALSVRHGGDAADESLDIFVNMDNLYLRNELVRRRTLGDDLIRQWYKYGLVILAVGMVFRQRQVHDSADDGEATEGNGADFDAIAEACKGLAVTVVPLMAQAHKRAIG